MSQTIHGQEGCILSRITMIINKRRFGQRRTCSRFNRIDLNFFPIYLIMDKRKGDACKVASSARTADNDIRVFSDFLKLFFKKYQNNTNNLRILLKRNPEKRFLGKKQEKEFMA